jgi:hypothetical protein
LKTAQLAIPVFLSGCLLATSVYSAEAESEALAGAHKELQPLLETYCFKCHNTTKSKAGVNLERFRGTDSVAHDPKTWEIVLAQLRDRTMPPENKPQPTDEQRDQLVSWIQQALQNLDESKIPKDPGRAVLHRLSRLEYNNTIRDLFGVDTKPADQFPPDGGGGGGFDNNAATLFLPPVLMERYLEAAGEILNAARSERVFVARPGGFTSERSAARKIFSRHAPRVFRRPAEKAEVERVVGLYDLARKRGENFEDGVKLGLKSLLVSPHFLFRVESESAQGGHQPVGEYELASRLSYFLWSSMPDEELFRLAAAKKLHDTETLEAQTRRKLLDPKARAIAENFAGQWLRVRELKTTAQPDARKFPEFTPAVRDAMFGEAVEFFNALLRDNRSLLDVIDAQYVFVNETLATFYGIEGVKGEAFQRVSLKDRSRGGVLGMGGVLTLTSYPRRTSPVLRGKWVLEEILGTPPPPPPPLVKSLPADDRPRDGLTFRQRLEQHRTKAECAGCHKRMDPLGFGLETFDAIGRWRTQISGQPVDASGQMTSGEKFTGPAELKSLLLKRTDDFGRNLTEKMLAYALGRGLEYYDTPVVKKIAKTLEADDFRAATLVTEIVKSYPFQYRRGSGAQLTQK